MKIIKNVMIIILLTSVISLFSCNCVMALNFDVNNPKWTPNSTTEVSNADKLLTIGNNVIGAIQIIASLSSVIVLVVLGIKYMLGSVEERAEYKKTMIPYVIGAIMVFGIINILGLIIDIVNTLL